jgi:hypothetical protein
MKQERTVKLSKQDQENKCTIREELKECWRRGERTIFMDFPMFLFDLQRGRNFEARKSQEIAGAWTDKADLLSGIETPNLVCNRSNNYMLCR